MREGKFNTLLSIKTLITSIIKESPKHTMHKVFYFIYLLDCYPTFLWAFTFLLIVAYKHFF